jgi:hypothetical protein
MAKTWEANYKGHTIKVRNSILSGEKLWVDDELQDQTHEVWSARLWGTIRSGEEEGEKIKAHIGGGFGQKCSIFANDSLVFSSH